MDGSNLSLYIFNYEFHFGNVTPPLLEKLPEKMRKKRVPRGTRNFTHAGQKLELIPLARGCMNAERSQYQKSRENPAVTRIIG